MPLERVDILLVNHAVEKRRSNASQIPLPGSSICAVAATKGVIGALLRGGRGEGSGKKEEGRRAEEGKELKRILCREVRNGNGSGSICMCRSECEVVSWEEIHRKNLVNGKRGRWVLD